MVTSQLKKQRSCGGFSLLELSIVITIVSVVAIMGLEGAAVYISSTAYKSTAERMATIDAALAKYRFVHGRLPCPAALSLPITDGGGTPTTNMGYGKEDCDNPIVIGGGVSSVSINQKGSGYIGYYTDVPLTISVSVSGGSGATAKGVVDRNTGAITSISITNSGSGYADGASVTITPDAIKSPSAPADLNSYLKIDAGEIKCADDSASPCLVKASDGGTGYTESYTSFPVSFTGGSGQGASGLANVNPASGEITSVTITNPGYGYDVVPTVSLDEKEGSGGIATANISPIAVGALPVRDLNLPLSYATDAYGSKFIYYVTADMTDKTVGTTNKFAASGGTIQMRSGQLKEPCTTNCAIDSGGSAYALISVGKDQRGGYSQRGTLIANCIPKDSFQLAIDAQNCIFEGTPTLPIGVTIPLGVLYNSTFNNGSQNSNYFDDLVTTRAKQDL